jgi:hypothetical protein
LKTSERQSNIDRMLGQASPISTQSWILVDTIWEVSARCPDATQRPRIFWDSFIEAKMSDSEDRPDARPSRPDVILLWKESRYSGKVIVEDRSDEGKLKSSRSTARVRICLELGFLKPIYRWL